MKKVFFTSLLQYFLIACLLFGMIYYLTFNQREDVLAIYVEGSSSYYTSQEMDQAHDAIIAHFDKTSKDEKIIEIMYSGDAESKEMEKKYNQTNSALFTVNSEINQKNLKSKDNNCQVLLCKNKQNKWQIIDTF